MLTSSWPLRHISCRRLSSCSSATIASAMDAISSGGYGRYVHPASVAAHSGSSFDPMTGSVHSSSTGDAMRIGSLRIVRLEGKLLWLGSLIAEPGSSIANEFVEGSSSLVKKALAVFPGLITVLLCQFDAIRRITKQLFDEIRQVFGVARPDEAIRWQELWYATYIAPDRWATPAMASTRARGSPSVFDAIRNRSMSSSKLSTAWPEGNWPVK